MNSKARKIVIIYSLIILLSILLFVGLSNLGVINNSKNDNTEADNSSEDILSQQPLNSNNESEPINPADMPKAIDPVSGEEYITDMGSFTSIPPRATIDSIRVLGQNILLKETLLDGQKIFRLKEMYNILAREKGKSRSNPMDIRIYKGSIESSQTNETVTYTFKTYIDGENYYSVVTYDIDNKMNLKILTEDKSKVLHEYNR